MIPKSRGDRAQAPSPHHDSLPGSRGAAGVEVRPCAIGRGLFALRAFAPGELILRLDGPRYEREDPIHATEQGANLLQTGRRTYILLTDPAVFANHSCDPNAGVVENRKLVAIRAIEPEDEITFDYSTTMEEDFWTLECRCGAENCRGKVTDFRNLPEPLRRRYLDLGVVQGFIAVRERRGNGRKKEEGAA
ncbi:MAG TPA: SET domain-containing protein-lysine N-methyltransferase [Candidatus Krumholzibacteria bacterium]|nr:SET domain-containing protein-lysine N-methyltransferase [Candidatus Krumholzibacteria bacterium]HRX51254.1 SET domain-containing protein-lysine N-methyltransferase [Candidatus Krumholzibacteria bacterium]